MKLSFYDANVKAESFCKDLEEVHNNGWALDWAEGSYGPNLQRELARAYRTGNPCKIKHAEKECRLYAENWEEEQ